MLCFTLTMLRFTHYATLYPLCYACGGGVKRSIVRAKRSIVRAKHSVVRVKRSVLRVKHSALCSHYATLYPLRYALLSLCYALLSLHYALPTTLCFTHYATLVGGVKLCYALLTTLRFTLTMLHFWTGVKHNVPCFRTKDISYDSTYKLTYHWFTSAKMLFLCPSDISKHLYYTSYYIFPQNSWN